MDYCVTTHHHVRRRAAHFTMVLACLSLLAISAHASTATLETPRPRASMELSDRSLPPLYLRSHIVNAEISGRIARVSTESIYHNDTAQQLEATYTFPLPPGATVEKFIMWMDGKPVEAQVGEKNSARRTYESIVARKKDPGLVEQVADGVFKMRIFPVLPGADQKIRLEYSYVLPLSANGTELTFDYPLSVPATEGKNDTVANSFVLSVRMDLESPIASVESPTHAISARIREEQPTHASASVEHAHAALDHDFSLKIKLKERALPVSSLAYRPAPVDGKAEDGTLMLLITPELLAHEEVPGKDVVMVMDTSGSMEGEKIAQARAALCACLKRLRPVDRFALISFSDDVTAFAKDWLEATPQNIDKATAYVGTLREGGSTNIDEAIRRALAFKGQVGRLRQVLFATDGCPTIGNTNIDQLAVAAAKKGENDPDGVVTRFFTFGIGYDVNTILLDKMAALTHGDRTYVRPEEDIARKVADLCDKIAAPVLTDVKVTFSDNLNVQHVYPPQTGDLYVGRQSVLTARYSAAGTGTVTIRGKRAGKDVVLEAPLTLPESTPQATNYLPKQWAIRKVGFLLDNIHMNGERAELRDEVIRLGTQYGIVTPYTSYLALESDQQSRQTAAANGFRYRDTIVPPDILAKAQTGDHFETINPDRPDSHDAYGNPDAHIFHNVQGQAGGGGTGGVSLEDAINDGGSVVGSGGGFGGGNGTGVDSGEGHGSFGARSGGGRRLMVKRHGGSRETESSVDLALKWLAANQNPDGSFDSAKFGATAKLDLATTGLATLAFLGAGHTEKIGAFRDNVTRAVAWLKAQQHPDGSIGTSDQLNDQELMAALALAEAAGMSNIADTRAAAQRALDYICAKDPELGGACLCNSHWDAAAVYSLGWYTMALKSGKVAGLRVPPEAFERVLKRIADCEIKTDAVSAFVNRKGDTQADTLATAAALLSRQFTGSSSEELSASVEALIQTGGVPAWESLNPHYCYFTTLCAFQQGGDIWKRWNEAEKKALTDNQGKDGDNAGSWNMTSDSGKPLGRVAQTALNCLSLEIYYRYVQLAASHAITPAPAPATPPAVNAPVLNSKADSGREGVDYSEYLRKLKEGIEPGK